VSMVEHMVEPPRLIRRLEVITGAGGRRRWSAAEKARIIEEALAPGAVVSEIARRHGMTPQHLHDKLALVSQKSKLTEAIRYALSRWAGLGLFLNHGRVEIDSNVV
jgi:hypothetical protein